MDGMNRIRNGVESPIGLDIPSVASSQSSQVASHDNQSKIRSQKDISPLEEEGQNCFQQCTSAGDKEQSNNALSLDEDDIFFMDPTKSSEESGDDFSVGQEFKEDESIKSWEDSKFISFPFHYLGFCRLQSERQKNYDKLLTKPSSSVTKSPCRGTTVGQSDQEKSLSLKENVVDVCSLKGIEKAVQTDSQQAVREVKTQLPSCSEDAYETSCFIKNNSQIVSIDSKNVPESGVSLSLSVQLSIRADKLTSNNNVEVLSIIPGKVSITKDSEPNSGDVVSSTSTLSGDRGNIAELRNNTPLLPSDSCGKHYKKSGIKLNDVFSDSGSDSHDKELFKTLLFKPKKQGAYSDAVSGGQLNSEERIRKFWDSINEDLGVKEETKPKSARKRILSESDEEKTNERGAKIKCLSSAEAESVVSFTSDSGDEKSGETEKTKAQCSKISHRAPLQTMNDLPENLDADEDLTEDTDDEIEVDVIEGTPVADKTSSRISTGPEKPPDRGGPFQSQKRINKIPPHSSSSDTESETRGTPENRLSPANKLSPKKFRDAPGRGRLSSDTLFVCSGLVPAEIRIVKKFAQVIGAGFSDDFTAAMTHLIVAVDDNGRLVRLSWKCLQALAAGKWIISWNWILDCLSHQKTLPEENYEALDTNGMQGPQSSRLSPRDLLKNIHLCFFGPFQEICLDNYQEIITMCGGVFVEKPEDFATDNEDVLRLVVVGKDAEINSSLCRCWVEKHKALGVAEEWFLHSLESYCLQTLPPYFVAKYSSDHAASCGAPEELMEEEDPEPTAGGSEECGPNCPNCPNCRN